MKKILALLLVLTLAFTVVACDDNQGEELTPVRVGASPTPHAALLQLVVDDMAALGYDLQISEYTDYVQPNVAVADGSLDANFFQHLPYLDSYNADNGTDLVPAGAVHYEPYGIYPGRDKEVTLETLPDGAIVSLPNDPSNEARALLLLEQAGLIMLSSEAGINATILDILANEKNLQFEEIAAEQLVNTLPDVDIAVINGNYAIQGGLSVAVDAIAVESADSTAADQYANYIVVAAGRESDPGIVALVQCMQSEEVRAYISSTFSDGSVVAKF